MRGAWPGRRGAAGARGLSGLGGGPAPCGEGPDPADCPPPARRGYSRGWVGDVALRLLIPPVPGAAAQGAEARAGLLRTLPSRRKRPLGHTPLRGPKEGRGSRTR